MRILTFTTLFPNAVDPAHGIFVYRRVAARAKNSQCEEEVIAPVPFMPGWIRGARWEKFSGVPQQEAIDGLRVHHPRYPLVPKISMQVHGLLMFLGARQLALKLHRQKAFDCIQAHYVYPDGFAAVMLGESLGIPVVVCARGTDINLFPSFRTIRPLIAWTLRNSAGIISVSSALKRRMIELGVADEKVQFIGNGVETDLFRIQSREEARQRLGLPQESRILLSVGSLRESKGHRDVIGAMAKIAAGHPDLKFYMVGEGDDRGKLEDQVQRLGLQDHVFLVGSRKNEEMPLWFNAADVSVLASSREGWPNVVLESLACGTPVIGTPVGEIPEILGAGDLGIVCQKESDALAAAIETALARTWDRMALSRFAQSRPWSLVAKEEELYLARVLASVDAKATQTRAISVS